MSAEPEILFLCSRLPFPPNKGDKVRSHALLMHLMQRHRVHLACFVENDYERGHIEAARKAVNGECLVLPISGLKRFGRMAGALIQGEPITAALFSSHALTNWTKSLCARRRIAATIVFGSAMAPSALSVEAIDPQTVLFDMVDIDSDKWNQLAARTSQPRRWIYRRESRLLLELERKSAGAFGATLLVSPYESTGFSRLAPESAAKIKPLVNGVDWNYFAPGSYPNPYPSGRTAVVMTGHMDYEPNANAALWFVDEILPGVREKIPEICFYAVGANPPHALRKRVNENFAVTGYVDDVRPYLQHARAVVAPLRIARGLQNKVLEAMAMQKPVVATWEATRALAVRPGVDLFVAHDAPSFAQSVIESVSGLGGEAVGAQARRFVRAHHDWSVVLGEFDRLLTNLAPALAHQPDRSAGTSPDSMRFAGASR